MRRHRVGGVVATPWRSLAHDRSDRTEDGFTLIELLIVIAVLPFVVGAITVSLISVFSLQKSVSDRISGSADAQIVSANFVSDVQNASMLTTESPSAPQCVPATQVPESTQVLGLQADGGQTVISYEEVPEGTANSLIRYDCKGGTTSTNTVSTNVPSNLQASISCATTIASECSGSTSYSTSWVSAAGIKGATLNVAETTNKDSFSYTLTAVPRAWSPASGSGAVGGILPVLLLGNGSPEATCAGASAQLTVGGEMALDSTSNGAATGSISAASFYTADTTDPSAALGSGVTSTGGGPPTIVSGPALVDPYRNLTAPSTAGLPIYTDGNYHGPGVYTTNPLSLTSATAFQSGIYIFEDGISASGHGSLTSDAGGVLFYVTGGSVDISGLGGFDLEPLSSPPSPTANLVIWQAASDSNPVDVSGNGSVNLIDGTIYAPGAPVGGAGNGSLSVKAIVANGVACAGNGTISISVG